MLSSFMFLFSTFCVLNHVKSYDLDFTSSNLDTKQVVLYEYKDPNDTKTIAKFFNAYTQDAFSSVKEGTYNIWDQRATHLCDFVKVFYESNKAVALKLGIQKRDPGNYLRNIEGLFYLRDEKTGWKNVSKDDYLKFVKEKGFKNISWVNYETDEKFPKHHKFRDVDVPIEPPQPKKEPEKSLRKEGESPAKGQGPPSPGRPATPGGAGPQPSPRRPGTPGGEPQQGPGGEGKRPGPEGPGSPGPEGGKAGPPPEGETDEQKRKRLAHVSIQDNSNVIPENEKKKSSFLTSTLLIPATVLLFYVSY